MAYYPPTIESYGGLKPYLDATKDKHNGYGGEDLEKNWNWGTGKHMRIASLAVMFGIHWKTMDIWLDRLHTEAGKPRTDKRVASTTNLPDNAK